MLGTAVTRVLSDDQSLSILSTHRDFSVKGPRFFDAIESTLEFRRFEYVINCIGLIRQIKGADKRMMYEINSKFPWRLATQCDRQKIRLIHITTDCVFSGHRPEGMYTEFDIHDPVDDYGLSKSIGEPTNCLNLRTSIIGPEKRGFLSLLEWARSNREQEVSGYTNHFWNGVTTTACAQVCHRIIKNGFYEEGVRHISSTTVSKFELLHGIDRALNLDLRIVPTITPETINRTLKTNHIGEEKILGVPSLDEMLSEMK